MTVAETTPWRSTKKHCTKCGAQLHKSWAHINGVYYCFDHLPWDKHMPFRRARKEKERPVGTARALEDAVRRVAPRAPRRAQIAPITPMPTRGVYNPLFGGAP